jgi:hypothetical protein
MWPGDRLFEALSRGLPPLMPERTRGQETIERALRMEREGMWK